MKNLNQKWPGLVLSLLLVVLAIAAVAFSFGKVPSQVTAPTPRVNYQENGNFGYLVYLKPSTLYGTATTQATPSDLQYPAGYVDHFHFSFSFVLTTSQPVSSSTADVMVTAGGTDATGKASTLTLLKRTTETGNFTAAFDLNPGVLPGGDITVNIYVYPTMLTSNGPVFEFFNQSFILKSHDGLLEATSDLSGSQDGAVGSLSYTQKGQLDYWVVLNSASPYGAVTLHPVASPPAPAPTTLPPGSTIITKLVDSIAANFGFSFSADNPVKQLSENVTVTAVASAGKTWSKSLTLLPLTAETGNFNISFVIDMDQLNQTLSAISAETGVPADTLTITATVNVSGQTDYGAFSDTFTPKLSTALGKDTITWNENLSQSKTGAIMANAVVANPQTYLGLSVVWLHNVALGFAALAVIFLLFSLAGLMTRRPAVSAVAESDMLVDKKYRGRLAVATSRTPAAGEQVVILDTMEDLVKVADELGKPVIRQKTDASHGHNLYLVIDGTTRYQYPAE